MNIDNLKKAADYVELIPQEIFGMEYYREGGDMTALTCDSIGCALGHLTNLFPDMVFYLSNGEINFERFSDNAFELEGAAWLWCFASEWSEIDDTPQGCANRIRFLVDNGEESAAKAWKDTRKKYKIN
jgi:hypothetical protein